MVLIKTRAELEREVVTKVGSIQLPHDLKGRLLEIEFHKAEEEFVRYMEQRDWKLYSCLPKNPLWLASSDSTMPMPFYALDWFGERKATKDAQERGASHQPEGYETREAHRGPLPTRREYSLEDSEGMVEYRCVGVFIAPKVATDLVVDSYLRKEQERQALNPTVFGPTSN